MGEWSDRINCWKAHLASNPEKAAWGINGESAISNLLQTLGKKRKDFALKLVD